MIRALRDLKQLKENHKIYVALADFMQVWGYGDCLSVLRYFRLV
jgi:hypothetical protein